jgi:hypothetical protein
MYLFLYYIVVKMSQKTPQYETKVFFEIQVFTFPSRLADSLGSRVTSVDCFFFIYVSFVWQVWFGVYLTLAFWIKLKILIKELFLIIKF